MGLMGLKCTTAVCRRMARVDLQIYCHEQAASINQPMDLPGYDNIPAANAYLILASDKLYMNVRALHGSLQKGQHIGI